MTKKGKMILGINMTRRVLKARKVVLTLELLTNVPLGQLKKRDCLRLVVLDMSGNTTSPVIVQAQANVVKQD
jgi:hypothetical protein